MFLVKNLRIYLITIKSFRILKRNHKIPSKMMFFGKYKIQLFKNTYNFHNLTSFEEISHNLSLFSVEIYLLFVGITAQSEKNCPFSSESKFLKMQLSVVYAPCNEFFVKK